MTTRCATTRKSCSTSSTPWPETTCAGGQVEVPGGGVGAAVRPELRHPRADYRQAEGAAVQDQLAPEAVQHGGVSRSPAALAGRNYGALRVAHACLFADVVQYMIDRDIEYEPIALVEDVNQAITNVHLSGDMHKEVALDLSKYIEPNPTLRPLLERIRNSGKKSFLCTNSSFSYINAGLKYMLGDDWRELFNVVSVSARKPKFYTRQRSFRMLDIGHKQVQWHAVRELRRGEVYTQGSVYQLSKLTGWVGSRVLYIGDNLFSDLVEPSRANGWRTGAIIRELEDEMKVQQTPEYQRLAFQINKIEELMRNIQNELRSEPVPQNHAFVDQLVNVHEAVQMEMENLINVNFGSVFRADTYPSQFAFVVQRYVDIYSARLENLLEYPSNHTFYPERIAMPHEHPTGAPRYE
ncbi:hypothetical protein ON010_g5452 [Phytophthora cinnamomi]|nr:hypothetical protein ON010_g5452 [Phytophthora cinnamomi]